MTDVRAGGDADLLASLASSVISRARPGEQVEAYVAQGGETEVRVYKGDVEHFVSAQSEGIGIRVIVDGRTGFAYAGTLAADAIEEVLAEARDNVAYGTVDDHAALAMPDGVAVTPQTLWSDDLAELATEDKIELAKELERLTVAGDPRIRIDDANYADGWSITATATSTGVDTTSRENGCYVTVSALADEGDETQSGYGYSVGRRPDEIDLDKAATLAVERATRLLGATKPPSGRVDIVLDPMVTASFLSLIGGTLSGEAVVKGRSLFRERIGDQIAAPGMTLVDDPTNPEAYTASETDGEGLATRRNVLIADGTLQQFCHSTYSARRAGATPTGNGVRGGFAGTPGAGAIALSLVPGHLDQEALIAMVDDGVLIQSVTGLHSGVNSVSGDFSAGASGLLVKGGTLARPVREFTIASTLQRMLLDVAAIGSDIDWLPSNAAGMSLVIRDVTVSGT